MFEIYNGGGGGIIHCFVPSQYTFTLLYNSYYKADNVILNNVGLGKQRKQSMLHYNNEGSGLASLTKRRLEHFNIDFTKSEKVQIITLDEYCFSRNIHHIHLLKIDVEGHELDVLHGATVMFQNKAIDMVTFEFGGCNIDTRTYFQDFWYFFKDKNMLIYRILPHNRLYKILSYNEMYEQFTTTNYLATSNDM